MTGPEAAKLIERVIAGDMEAMAEAITILTDPVAAEPFRPGVPMWQLWATWESSAGFVVEFDYRGGYKWMIGTTVVRTGHISDYTFACDFRPVGCSWVDLQMIQTSHKNTAAAGRVADLPGFACDECGLQLSGRIVTARTESGICLTPRCTTLRAERVIA